MKKRIFNLIIVDESGSMHCIQNSTISGINETLQSIRQTNSELQDTESFVTLMTFSSCQVKTIYDSVNAEQAEDITAQQYNPNGCTPLYDAVGNGILSLQKQVAETDSVFVTIITDGLENASKEFTHAAIRKLIEDKKKADWVFTFIGANIDVEQTSKDLGIDFCAKFEQTEEDTKSVWAEIKEAWSGISKCYCSLADEEPDITMNEIAKRNKIFSNRRKK